MIVYDVLGLIWLFLAAALANSAPVFANKIPGLNNWKTPLDFGYKFRGKPIFGRNKTWRGLTFGVIVAITVVCLQKYMLSALDTDITIAGHSFNELPALTLGILLGAGPLIGDAVESFFKRQFNVEPGKSWFPFDQIDYILGSIIFTYTLVPLPLSYYIILLVIGFCIHLVASYLGYLLKLKDAPI